MRFRFPFNWYNKFGTIPSEFREAMSYEEQILWLCQANQNIQEQFDSFNVSLESLELRVSRVESDKQDKFETGENLFMFNNQLFAELNLDKTEDLSRDEFVDLSGNIGTSVDLTPISRENTAWTSIDVKPEDFFLIRGTFTLVKANNDLVIETKHEQNEPVETFLSFKVLREGKLIISWYDTDKNIPYFAQTASPDYIINKFNAISSWNYEDSTSLVDEITASSSNNEIPTAEAVYNAIMAGGSSGTPDYEYLSNKPSINGVTLEGNLTSDDLHLDNGLPYLADDEFNVWNLDNGVYIVENSQSTILKAGNIVIPVGLGDDSAILIVYGSTTGVVPKGYMLLNIHSNRPLFEVGYCTSENDGTRITQSANAISFNVNQVNMMGDSSTAVPTEHSVKGYVDSKVGDIETILNTLNVGSGV